MCLYGLKNKGYVISTLVFKYFDKNFFFFFSTSSGKLMDKREGLKERTSILHRTGKASMLGHIAVQFF